MTNVLHISLATSGLVRDADDVRQQPWICRIAAALCDDSGAVLDSFACLIRAEDNRQIEPAASIRHGISTSMCARGGVHERLALGMVLGFRAAGTKRPQDLPGMASYASAIVAWDAEFIRTILNARYARHGEPHGSWLRPGLQFISIQDLALPWCKLPAEDGSYRKPTRDEAAAALLGLPARPLPHSLDTNLDRERAVYAALRERNAFEEAA